MMSEPPYTVDELLAVLIARDLREDDRVMMIGANQPMARAGAAMASMRRLPDARVMLGFAIDNLAGRLVAPETLPYTLDPRTLDTGEAWMYQGEVFDYIRRFDVFFFGGFQVDRRGNVNLLGIPDGNGGWKLRGPGPIAQPTISTYCRGSYLLMLRHDPATFVDRVSLISALGDRARRRELGLPGGGPRLVLSPLGVFDFNDQGDMRLVSAHEGVTVADVVNATGFTLDIPADPQVTRAPTAEELTFLRERVDTTGTLRVTHKA